MMKVRTERMHRDATGRREGEELKEMKKERRGKRKGEKKVSTTGKDTNRQKKKEVRKKRKLTTDGDESVFVSVADVNGM